MLVGDKLLIKLMAGLRRACNQTCSILKCSARVCTRSRAGEVNLSHFGALPSRRQHEGGVLRTQIHLVRVFSGTSRPVSENRARASVSAPEGTLSPPVRQQRQTSRMQINRDDERAQGRAIRSTRQVKKMTNKRRSRGLTGGPLNYGCAQTHLYARRRKTRKTGN